VTAIFNCQEGHGGPGLLSCTGTVPNGHAIDTAAPGTHTFSVTAISKDGLSTTVAHTYTVVGPPSVSISSPANRRTFKRGQRVQTTFSCTEASGGPGLRSCRDSNGASAPHGRLITKHAGIFTYRVTAISADGQRTTAQITYRVTAPYRYEHFAITDIKTQPDGRVSFSIKTTAPGRVDVLETAWKSDESDAIAPDILLSPAPHRFVFARAESPVAKGPSTYVVHPNSRGTHLVSHHRFPVRIRLWVSYTPAHGAPRIQGFYYLLAS
jgi:hypothetical protein